MIIRVRYGPVARVGCAATEPQQKRVVISVQDHRAHLDGLLSDSAVHERHTHRSGQ